MIKKLLKHLLKNLLVNDKNHKVVDEVRENSDVDIREERKNMFIAYSKDSNEEVGELCLRSSEDNYLQIGAFHVKESEREKGIGRDLINKAIEIGSSRGVKELIVYPCREDYENEKPVEVEDLYKIYKKLDFRFENEEDENDEKKPNHKMVRKIK